MRYEINVNIYNNKHSTVLWEQAQNFGAEFLSADVTSLNLNDKIKEITTSKGLLKSLSVIIATGANPRRVGFEGEDKKSVIKTLDSGK